MDNDEKMKEDVIETMATVAQGIILLPVLQLKHLQGLFRKSQIRKALRTMPKDPFSWISHAQRPLLIDELRNALAVDFGETEGYERVRQVDMDNLVRPQLLVDLCAGLITIEPESQVVRLVHFTTQEYFNKNSDLHFPDLPAIYASENFFDGVTFLGHDPTDLVHCTLQHPKDWMYPSRHF
ncbi:uncharacterized protein A1O9_08425 [Exophiala aquamarina CBS 119918]|uniref:GPI inositol-deacylase winged helix domain-containing protein n=1 Tax=Exophiala aquamarina CBS 119918 TaxID=1182545 RepID=A0A072PJH9_9EURO|nr:uncharacterized protein A1O9_08425 [Exophiala aquamarina CBS 119918]KEF55675.1 hypothetical protein A1O9_08425 [Exophiala aquamarina CBS 119918]